MKWTRTRLDVTERVPLLKIFDGRATVSLHFCAENQAYLQSRYVGICIGHQARTPHDTRSGLARWMEAGTKS